MNKECSLCRQTKSVKEFSLYKNRNWYQAYCKPCRKQDAINRKNGVVTPKIPATKTPMPSHKECLTCKTLYPIETFYNKKGGKWGKDSNCRGCRDTANKEKSPKYLENIRNKRKNNPEFYKNKAKNISLKSTYGITLEDYNRKLKEQNNKCDICKRDSAFFDKSLAVDHCHKTGKIRSLLCSNCNTALGTFEKYIEEFNLYVQKYSKN